MELIQYDIVLVNLDLTMGSEMRKTRPCVVISPDEMNRYLQTVVIAPMTTVSRPYPSRVPIEHNNKNGWISLDQVRTIDRMRVIKQIGELDPGEIRQVKQILREIYVD